MPPSNTTAFKRSTNACESCRRRKVKCSGKQPCQTCSRQNIDCIFGAIGRRGYSEAYVQKLLDKIKSQEDQIEDQGNGPSAAEADISHASSHRISVAETPQSAGPTELPLSPVTELASGPAFESRVRSILRDHVDSRQSDISPNSAAYTSSSLDQESSDNWRNAVALVDGVSVPGLLPRSESFRLFEVFSSLMGINQHFFDPRSFSDSMDLLYQSDASRLKQMQTLWYAQYLLVMAMGMLIGSPSERSAKPPGTSFFAEAMKRLPPMHELGSHKILAVEILCLASLYLQWCDRKHDAYLYIGCAVRLAIALGCSLPHEEQQGLSSEISHKVRVWWTAYMLDRRLSAGLGLPTGADDRALRCEFPRPSAGFQHPLPLIINIQIAQATGEIMTSFYGNTALTQTDLVKRIQDTLQNLHEIGCSIPSALTVDFSDSSATVSRTSASLHLMLFQAIILCIRPILLQQVKEKVQYSKDNSPQPPPSTIIKRLCQTCQEAAAKSIRILSSLRQDKTIALFGYFDLDATFSAAFVLAMMGFVETDLQKAPDGLSRAAEVLQYLSDAGNSAAQRRLAELKQFCYHVLSPVHITGEWSWLKEDNEELPRTSSHPRASTGEAGAVQSQQADSTNLFMSVEPTAWTGWQAMSSHGEHGTGEQGGMLDFSIPESFHADLSHDAGDIYSCFNDPTLPLTGVDDVDWAEIGKIFNLRSI